MSNYLQMYHDYEGKPMLPRSIRAYFDADANITDDERLLELAHGVWLGVDLYALMKDKLNYAPELELSFTRSTARLIERLRSNNESSLSFDALTNSVFRDDKEILKPMPLKELVKLFRSELLLRYRFNRLAVFRWNYKDIESRYEDIDLVNKIRSATPAPLIPISEQEVKELNPWQDILDYERADWGTFYDEESRWLLKDEAYYLRKFNEKNKGKNCEYIFNLRPEPFCGNPLTAKVIVLSLNPGYNERQNRIFAKLLNSIPSTAEVVKNHKDKQLQLRADGMFCEKSGRDAQCMLDDWYWYDILSNLKRSANLPTDDAVFENVAVVQYVGYFSKSYKSLPAGVTLPSQRFTRLMIHFLATQRKDVLFVVSRSESEWRELIGEEIWNLLESENRLVHRKQFTNKNGIQQTIRTQGFNKNTFAADGFQRVLATLQSL